MWQDLTLSRYRQAFLPNDQLISPTWKAEYVQTEAVKLIKWKTSDGINRGFCIAITLYQEGSPEKEVRKFPQGQGFVYAAWTSLISTKISSVRLTLDASRISLSWHGLVAPKTTLARRGCLKTNAANKEIQEGEWFRRKCFKWETWKTTFWFLDI